MRRTQPLRVLHLIARSAPPASAIAVDHHGLMVALGDAGVDVGAMTNVGLADAASDGCAEAYDFVDGVAYYRLHPSAGADDASGVLHSLTSIAEQLLEIVRPEILHAASIEVAPLAVALGKRHSLPVISELEREPYVPSPMLVEAVAEADRVVAVNERQYARAVAAGVRPSRLRIVPAFLAAGWFEGTTNKRSGVDAPVVGTVAYRGDSPAIPAVSSLSDSPTSSRVVVLVCDSAGDQSEGHRHNRSADVQQIKIPANEAARCLARMDVVVAATAHEALDALAAGRSVVGVASAVDVVPQASELRRLLNGEALQDLRGTRTAQTDQVPEPILALDRYLDLYAEVRPT